VTSRPTQALFALYHVVRGELVPFGNLVTVPVLGALSILVAGWLTVPVGFACGALAWHAPPAPARGGAQGVSTRPVTAGGRG